jgi:hypothetical protein
MPRPSIRLAAGVQKRPCTKSRSVVERRCGGALWGVSHEGSFTLPVLRCSEVLRQTDEMGHELPSGNVRSLSVHPPVSDMLLEGRDDRGVPSAFSGSKRGRKLKSLMSRRFGFSQSSIHLIEAQLGL